MDYFAIAVRTLASQANAKIHGGMHYFDTQFERTFSIPKQGVGTNLQLGKSVHSMGKEQHDVMLANAIPDLFSVYFQRRNLCNLFRPFLLRYFAPNAAFRCSNCIYSIILCERSANNM